MPALFHFYIKWHQPHSVHEIYGTITNCADVRITNESALHASRGETLDVARDPDVTSPNIISPPLRRTHQLFPRPPSKHLQALVPEQSTVLVHELNQEEKECG